MIQVPYTLELQNKKGKKKDPVHYKKEYAFKTLDFVQPSQEEKNQRIPNKTDSKSC